MKITDTDLHRGDIEKLFGAVAAGLSSMEAKTLTHTGTPDIIEVDRFNRMLVTIDGRQYCISIFQPAQAPIEPVEVIP